MTTKKLTTKEIHSKNLARNKHPLLSESILLLHNIRSMHNIGSAFRTADVFGIKSILLSGYSPVPPRPEISKTAIGADETVPWKYSDNIFATVENLKKQDFVIAGLEQTHSSILLQDFKPQSRTSKMCFIFGNEVTGIEEDLLDLCDVVLEIPQYGHKHSLNVSVSIGVALYSFIEKNKE